MASREARRQKRGPEIARSRVERRKARRARSARQPPSSRSEPRGRTGAWRRAALHPLGLRRKLGASGGETPGRIPRRRMESYCDDDIPSPPSPAL